MQQIHVQEEENSEKNVVVNNGGAKNLAKGVQN